MCFIHKIKILLCALYHLIHNAFNPFQNVKNIYICCFLFILLKTISILIILWNFVFVQILTKPDFPKEICLNRQTKSSKLLVNLANLELLRYELLREFNLSVKNQSTHFYFSISAVQQTNLSSSDQFSFMHFFNSIQLYLQ